uniref:Uncharacterized protein n=1 Tax=Heterorhabditis bacteriophora TaxID=37862 RepID=A0A1I7WGT0_HETBA
MTVLTRLIGSGGYAFDSLCASYGLEGNLRDMSSTLLFIKSFLDKSSFHDGYNLYFVFSLNQKSETPTNAFTDRSMTFDLSFTMLTRIAYKYNTLLAYFYLKNI